MLCLVSAHTTENTSFIYSALLKCWTASNRDNNRSHDSFIALMFQRHTSTLCSKLQAFFPLCAEIAVFLQLQLWKSAAVVECRMSGFVSSSNTAIIIITSSLPAWLPYQPLPTMPITSGLEGKKWCVWHPLHVLLWTSEVLVVKALWLEKWEWRVAGSNPDWETIHSLSSYIAVDEIDGYPVNSYSNRS